MTNFERKNCPECKGHHRIAYCKTCKRAYNLHMYHKKAELKARMDPFASSREAKP